MNALNLPLGLSQGPGLLGAVQQQPQQPQEAFQWGAGGSRMTRDAIARQREMAMALMQADTSPVYDPWQGLARVAANVVGGFQERRLRNRERENSEYSQQIMNQLTGGPLPAAGGGAGSSPPASPSTNDLAALMSDPYASDSVKQFAKMQYEQMINRQNKQFEYDNRQVPEIIQLQRMVDNPDIPATERAAAAERIKGINDQFINFSGPDIGTYVGRQSGLAAFLGGGSPAPVAEPPATLPRDFNQGGPVPSASGNFPL